MYESDDQERLAEIPGLPQGRVPISAPGVTPWVASASVLVHSGVAEHAIYKIGEKFEKTGTKSAPKLLKAVSQLGRAQKAISSAMKLEPEMKDALRALARRIMARTNPAYVRAVAAAPHGAKSIPVHHKIPLEWAHLMGKDFNPNAAENLVALTKGNHDKISKEWEASRMIQSSMAMMSRMTLILVAATLTAGCRENEQNRRIRDPAMAHLIEQVFPLPIQQEGEMPEQGQGQVRLYSTGWGVIFRIGATDPIVSEWYDRLAEKTTYRGHTIGQYGDGVYLCSDGYVIVVTYLDSGSDQRHRLQVKISTAWNGKPGEKCYSPNPYSKQVLADPYKQSMFLMKRIVDYLLPESPSER